MQGMQGMIKKNKNTVGHAEFLQRLGYKVSDNEDHFLVEVTAFVTSIDLSENSIEVLKDLVRAKKALTYSSTIVVSKDGEKYVLSQGGLQFRVIRYLESVVAGASALVMKPVPGCKKAPAPKGASIDVLLG